MARGIAPSGPKAGRPGPMPVSKPGGKGGMGGGGGATFQGVSKLRGKEDRQGEDG